MTTRDQNNAPDGTDEAHTYTNFSVDAILSAGFGRIRPEEHCITTETTGSRTERRSERRAEQLSDVSGLPAWVFCTRYSDRPSSGPRIRRNRPDGLSGTEMKRPRTAFSQKQLEILGDEFETNQYLTEKRRQRLARELNLRESQVKIWFQNKRAKAKKLNGTQNQLALELMAQGLYNHSTLHVNAPSN